MRITKPRNWHLYSEEMKRIWMIEEYPKIVETHKIAKKQFDDFIEEIKKNKEVNKKQDLPF